MSAAIERYMGNKRHLLVEVQKFLSNVQRLKVWRMLIKPMINMATRHGPPVQWYRRLIPQRIKRPGREVDPHLHLVPGLRMNGTIPPPAHKSSWRCASLSVGTTFCTNSRKH
jgi:hypothetical protein